MSKESNIDDLSRALRNTKDREWTVNLIEGDTTICLMLKTPCHLSLFAFVEPPRSIVETEASAKQELLSLRDSSKEPWPRDLNLVLIIGERTTADPAIIRRLVDNRYV